MPVMDYFINYDYIANELCENKEKPELHCNGKCHLMKELAKASEEEKPVSGKKQLQHEYEVLFYYEPIDFALNNTAVLSQKAVNMIYCNLYTHINSASVFHPPVFIS